MTWNPFKRKEEEKEAQKPVETPAKEGGKGRPTPKRRQAEAENLRPIVPADRKAANKAAKAKLRAKQDAEYEAMQTGDVRNMPKAERLPWRIYIRDYVDARWNVAEWFMPVAGVLMIAALIISSAFQYTTFAMTSSMVIFVLLYGYVIVAGIDLWFMWRKLKPLLVAKYGERSVAKGMRSCSYACSRAMQLRRWRMPKPTQPKRGNWPK
ncbi:DUF3043 domain-containing protein [Bifidobacterium vespertilionis]|uniref:DUF3043 domain-containing protein n=1 Tax=Bifidobacterium vespertilionis TaxID=2562524 RepID=A0A5J5DZX6_9BIFI|nr:DUF3043 domain-containing protein [Bifidobacterium vespertilionis]KAA8822464.1 DUF3043 domain-containing protein [Bifidobacterium vespertilionis]KAA8824474.1 DUF3043 domain-containing protein [Bifidobacterium vespertilionis]